MSTNMSTEQILSLYNILKDVAKKASASTELSDALGIQKLYLSGKDARIIDYGGTNLSLYNYVLYDESVKAVSDAMKVNLGLKKEKVVKKFSFDINDPYEEKVIGKMDSGTTGVTTLPSFVGKTLSYVNSFCSANGIKVNVKYVTSSGTIGTVTNQSVSAGASVSDVKSITVSVIEKNTSKVETTQKQTETKKEQTTDNTKKEDTTDSSTTTDKSDSTQTPSEEPDAGETE